MAIGGGAECRVRALPLPGACRACVYDSLVIAGFKIRADAGLALTMSDASRERTAEIVKHILALVGFGLFVGCTTAPLSSVMTYAIPTFPGDQIITSSRTGTLYLAGGCLLFRDVGGQSFLPVFTTGSRFDGRSIVIARPGGERTIRVGQRLRIEGDAQAWANVPSDYDLQRYQRQCLAPPFFVSDTR